MGYLRVVDGDTHQLDPGAANVVHREPLVEEPDERADRAGGIIVLRLAEEQGASTLEIAQIDVIAQSRAHRAALAVDDEHDLRLGIVPARIRADSDLGAVADRREDRRLGEDLRVRTDRDLEILRPEPVVDQRLLERRRFRGAGDHRADGPADPAFEPLADRGGGLRVAAGPLLDHALDRRDREGDSGGLHHLQVERREEPGRLELVHRADPDAGSGRLSAPVEQVGHGRRRAGHVEHRAAADHDRRRPIVQQKPPDENRLGRVGRQLGCREADIHA